MQEEGEGGGRSRGSRRYNELKGYLRDDANETDEAGQMDESRSGGECAEHKLLGTWLDRRDTQSLS